MITATKGITARLRQRKAGRLKRAENANKQFVRDRENHKCRFPLCSCGRIRLRLEVSHQEHKGMGGDPTGERSVPALMVNICFPRHKDAKISLDKKTLRWVELTDAGANGPIAWEVNVGRLSAGTLADQWIELAREARPGVLEPMTDRGRGILERLAAELAQTYQ